MKNNYDDIINLPHFTSLVHPRMSIESRAAQFAPFAALTGYDEVIKETARLTNERVELNEDDKNVLDGKLHFISENLEDNPLVEIVYFVPDLIKAGGKYITKKCVVKKIDMINRYIVLDDKNKILIDDIISIDSDIFNFSID